MKNGLFLLIGIHICFTLTASATTPFIVYGEDNRKDTYEVTSPLYLSLAESTAAMIHKSQIVVKGTTAELNGMPVSEIPFLGNDLKLCSKEKFYHQTSASQCSGFLVGENTLVTAGHCMQSQSDCDEFNWVFNFKVTDANDSAVSVDLKDVYQYKKIVKQWLEKGMDFAVIKLDRVTNRKALKIAKADPKVGTPLVMIGHPSGLPQKITDGGKVVALISQGFLTSLDAFGGNSGSAVFNSITGELVGILTNGNTDYRKNAELSCVEVNKMSEAAAEEGVSSFKQFLSFL